MTSPARFTERSAWTRTLAVPLRAFLGAETASAALLVATTIAALVWVNAHGGSYGSTWDTTLAIELDGRGIELSLREWVNSGLMTFFFFVIGLEARREWDVGELRERRRVTLPLVAGLTGMLVPVGIYLAFNAGNSAAHGWGVAMSTDTAFALGVLALAGRRVSDRLRTFLLTLLVVDDLIALVVIVAAYSDHIDLVPLTAAAALFAVILAVRQLRRRAGIVYFLLGVGVWVALLEAGVEPILVGLGMGLLTYAYPASRDDLERATDQFRLFREQPTPELARVARSGLESAISPNERLQMLYLPWASYVIVPLFALANAGVSVDADSLGGALTSPVTLGIAVAYVAGKPLGISAGTWLVTVLSRRRLRPSVGWIGVVGTGAAAGTGFTISLLIASIAFDGETLEEAKLGVLAAALTAAALSTALLRGAGLLPVNVRLRGLLGRAESLLDLAVPFDPRRDRARGPDDAAVTLVEYGDFQCEYCGLAENAIQELLGTDADVRYVWRHLPLNDVHSRAQVAAEASEAAAAQGKFWEMHDLLLAHPDQLAPPDLFRYATEIGLDTDRFAEDLERHAGAGHIADDVDSADASGVGGTPTFFVNGRRHWGAYDIEHLTRAVRDARARAGSSRPS